MNDKGWLALVAFLGGFVIAQTWKFFEGMVRGQTGSMKWGFKTVVGYAMRSGGMPSGHSASMAALTACLGCLYGVDSGIFALAMACTIVVVYDAIHVRFAVGEQGKALNGLLQQNGEKGLPIVEGHTLIQAAVGVILGVLVGLAVYFIVGR